MRQWDFLTRAELRGILELLSKERSQRRVAALARRSRGLVTQIARGQHPLQLQPAPQIGAGESPEEADPRGRPKERCPGCGRKIVMSCQACLAESHRVLSRFARRVNRVLDDQPLGLNLKPEHQARYLECKARRDAGLAPLVSSPP